MDMFLPVRFKTSVHLAPKELTLDFTENLIRKLQANLEGICTRHGYVKPGSIEIVRRSVGQFVKQHFNGHLRFDVVCRAEVCNPPQNTIVDAVVKNKNELGVHAESFLRMGDNDVPVLDIIIPKRAAGIQSEVDLNEVDTGDHIFVEVLGKRFQLNDRKISIIGRAVKNKTVSANAEGVDDVDDTDDIDDVADTNDNFDEEEDQEDMSDMEGGKENSDDEEDVRTVEVEEDIDAEDGGAEVDLDDVENGADADEYDYDDDLGSEVDEAPSELGDD